MKKKPLFKQGKCLPCKKTKIFSIFSFTVYSFQAHTYIYCSNLHVVKLFNYIHKVK